MRKLRWIVMTMVVAVALAGLASVAGAQSEGEKPTATEVGVTAKEIRIAVIADVDNPVAPGLFQGSVDGVHGFAKYVNATGGLAGRKVVVDFIDSQAEPRRGAQRHHQGVRGRLRHGRDLRRVR